MIWYDLTNLTVAMGPSFQHFLQISGRLVFLTMSRWSLSGFKVVVTGHVTQTSLAVGKGSFRLELNGILKLCSIMFLFPKRIMRALSKQQSWLNHSKLKGRILLQPYSLSYQRELYVVWFLSISSSSSSKMCSEWHLNCLRSTQSYSWTTNHVEKNNIENMREISLKSVWIQVSSPSMTTPSNCLLNVRFHKRIRTCLCSGDVDFGCRSGRET